MAGPNDATRAGRRVQDAETAPATDVTGDEPRAPGDDARVARTLTTGPDSDDPALARTAATEHDGTAPLPGDVIDRYRVLRRLGAGGMGVVYAARDPALDRMVALKILPTLDPAHRELLEGRLRREAQALARLDHPNVISVYDVGVAEVSVFIAMQLIDGTDLGVFLAEQRPQARRILEVFVAAGRGLAAAHEAGIIHRDFKPANVLVDRSGRVLVGDFGLARAVADAPDPSEPASSSLLDASMTHAGAVMGTPMYMAPEQHRGEAVTTGSDQYSFCLALWEALWGAPAFAARPWTRATALAAMERDAIVPSPRPRGVPGRVERALRRGLRHEPAQRWPSMSALLAHLTPRSRAGLVWGGAAAAAIGAAVAATAWWTDAPDQRAACRAASAAIDGTWPGRSAALTRAYAGSGLPGADAAARRLSGELDRYAADWRSLRLEACEARTVRAETAPALSSMQLRCLDERRTMLEDLLVELTSRDPAHLARGLEMAALLPSPRDCSSTLQAMLPVPPARDLAEISALRVAAARMLTLRAADRLSEVRALLDELVPRAERLGYAPVLAELLVEQALVLEDTDVTAARGLAARAAELAIAARHDRIAAQAIKVQIMQAAVRSDVALAEVLLPLGRAAAARTGSVELQAEMTTAAGMIHRAAGRHDEAIAACERAVAELPPVASNMRMNAFNCIALAAIGKSDLVRAESAAQQTLALIEERYGPDAKPSVLPLQQLALVRRRQGRTDESIALTARARDIVTRVLGADSSEAGKLDVQQAGVLRELGKLDEALVVAQRALAIAERTDRPPTEATVRAQLEVAMVLRNLERYDEMRPHFDAALTLGDKLLPPENGTMMQVRFGYAAYLSQVQRLDEANAMYETLAAAMRKAGDRRLPMVRMQQGQIVVDRHGCKAALPIYEEAVAELIRTKVDMRNLLVGKMMLAECLWEAKVDRPRARALVTEVRDGAKVAGKAGAKMVADAEQWLREHR